MSASQRRAASSTAPSVASVPSSPASSPSIRLFPDDVGLEPALFDLAREGFGLGLALLPGELRLGLRGKRDDDLVEHVRDATAVDRGNRERPLPPEGVELGRLQLALRVVALVDGHEDRRLRPSEQLGGFLVGRGQARDGLDDEDDDVRLGDRDRAWSWTRASMGSCGSTSSPPVSTIRNRRPFQSASPYSRSRVVRARSSTIAARPPTTRLNSVLLPTFGLPTIATIGRPLATVAPPSWRPGARWCWGARSCGRPASPRARTPRLPWPPHSRVTSASPPARGSASRRRAGPRSAWTSRR